MTSDGGTGESPSELLALLDSDNRLTVEQTRALIHENLYTSRDPTLLNALIEFYLETRSVTALQILTNLHEGRAHQMFERLNEHLKHSQTRLDTLTLLGHIVRRQPSWLYKIVSTSLFDTLLKYLKSDTDVLMLVSGLMIISTLLPLVPASVGGKLDDLFDIFVQLSSFSTFKPGNTPAVHLLHLNVAVYIFFHRLYAMYPNNLLDYLRSQYGGKNLSRSLVFQEVVKPMMEQVRLHPCLVTETANSEIGKTRWRAKEPHDIVIECQKLSLDPMDRVQEDGGFNMSWASRQSLLDTTNVDKSASSTLMISGDAETQGVDLSRLKERRMSDSATQTGKSLQSGDSGVDSAGAVISADDLTPAWSPTVVCGLCTPPSSQMSPSASYLELSKSLTLDQSQCSTPAMVQTPGESPTPSLAGDISSSIVPSKGRKILLSRDAVSGHEMSTETTKASSREDTLQKDLYFALLQHKEIQSSSAPAALSHNRTSTPKSRAEPVEAAEVGCDIVEEAVVPFRTEISENCNSVVAVDRVRDREVMTVVDSTVEEHGQMLTHEKETVASELNDEQLPSSHLSGGGVLLELDDHHLSGSSSGKTLQNMLHEADTIVDRTKTITSESIDEDSRETSSISVSQSGELLADSSTAAFLRHTETLVGDIKDKAGQLESKSSEISLDDAYKSRSEAGVIPQSCTFLISSTWPWKSCHDSSAVDDVGQSGKVQCKPLPMDVLDMFIKLGSGIHVDEVARIPLVSQPGTDWTHYGGNPPVDEIDILRRQIQLLHQQLLYERHKCEQHALRNRRLISKTFKAVQYKEELQATKDQLKLQEEKMRELTEALNKESENSRKLKELTSSWDNQQQTQIRNLLNENAQLQYAKQEAEGNLKVQKKEFDELQLAFHQAKSSIFTLVGEVKKLKEQLAEKENLALQVDVVSKELLVMGEINQQQKDVIKKLSVSESQNPEAVIQLESVHKELSSVKQEVRRQKAELEALTTNLSDSEVLLSQKDMEVKELKKFTENVKGTYISELKGLEDKYAVQKKVNQTLESHILSLHTTLDNQHRKTKRTRKVDANQTESQETKSPTSVATESFKAAGGGVSKSEQSSSPR